MIRGLGWFIFGGSVTPSVVSSGWFSLMRRVPDESTNFGDEYSLLPVTSPQSKERLMSGPGGRPEADGQKMLDPEAAMGPLWLPMAQGGFRFSQLLRRDQVPDDDSNYLGVTVWDDRAAYDKASVDTSSAGDILERPAMNVLYEGQANAGIRAICKLVLESEQGP
eukprot:Skav225388  [mRNA]  locus=scaffold2656:143418:150312:+ [translate_table: standard]